MPSINCFDISHILDILRKNNKSVRYFKDIIGIIYMKQTWGDNMNLQTDTEIDSSYGLSEEQVAARVERGQVNKQIDRISKSYKEIIHDNIFTLFNLINVVLAGFIIFIGSWRNLLFMGVILSNIVIGILQEIRAKRVLDKLSLITQSSVKVRRSGEWKEIHIDDVVLDDIISLSTSNQIIADAIVIDGRLEVNESLVTGESDIIIKQPGDELYSGSFVVSGNATCQVLHVGEDNYASTIMKDAKVFKKHKSQLRDSINYIIKIIGFVIIPMGIALFVKQYFISGYPFDKAIIAMVAALVGMIPEGLVLLTSVALAVGTINLARKQTLVQELYCIETLARVDTLCLDKTGTIKEGNMQVEDILVMEEGLDIKALLANFQEAIHDENATAMAIRNFVGKPAHMEKPVRILPFSSARKCSAVTFESGTYVLGAYEFVCDKKDPAIVAEIEKQANMGNRVLVFMQNDTPIKFDDIEKDGHILALVLLSDPIRKEAPQTLDYFLSQGVDIKVISGDDPRTVHAIAKKANLKNHERYIDVSTLKDEEIDAVVKHYTIFGRVSPKQKKLMIAALKKQGHITAMIGDGVNDVMALKEADCSISVAQGSEAAKNIANLVLLDNNFAHMPHIVDEGRRVINNIQRAASLFLVKTTFSTMLAFLTLFLIRRYPFEPIQLTLISSLTIGIPSFFLALEPNHARVQGNFLLNVFSKAFPGALCVVLSVVFVHFLGNVLPINEAQMTTMTVLLTGTSSLIVLYRVCIPFTRLRFIVFVIMTALFIAAVVLLPNLFVLVRLSFYQAVCTLGAMFMIPIVMDFFFRFGNKLKLKERLEQVGK